MLGRTRMMTSQSAQLPNFPPPLPKVVLDRVECNCNWEKQMAWIGGGYYPPAWQSVSLCKENIEICSVFFCSRRAERELIPGRITMSAPEDWEGLRAR